VVLNHADPNHAKNLQEASGGKGFNIIVEMVASANLPLDLQVAATFGRIIIIGSRGDVPISPLALMVKEVDIRGLLLYFATDAEVAESGKVLEKLLAEKFIQPVIDQELPLEKAEQAHIAVMEHSGGAKGKILLVNK